MGQLVTTRRELLDCKIKIEFKSLPLDDPKQRCPDISKAQNLLNWEPKISLYDGLKQTAAYFRGIL